VKNTFNLIINSKKYNSILKDLTTYLVEVIPNNLIYIITYSNLNMIIV